MRRDIRGSPKFERTDLSQKGKTNNNNNNNNNELYRRRTRRKATKKEKKIIKELKASIGKETTSYNLRNSREQWLDTLRYKNIKLAKCEEKRRRKQDNVMFQRNTAFMVNELNFVRDSGNNQDLMRGEFRAQNFPLFSSFIKSLLIFTICKSVYTLIRSW